MYRVFRYKTTPQYWPATATVYVDKSPTRVDHYVTDNNGNPTLVYGGPGVPVVATWGTITGTLSSQTDLQAALASKYDASNPTGYQTASQVSTAIASGLTGYATQSWVTGQGYLTGITSGLVTAALGYTPYNSSNPSNYQDASQVNALISTGLTGYATQSWVTSQGYLTSASLTGYATQSWVTSQNYITAAALTGYATQSWVNSQGYLVSTEDEIIGLILTLG